jgi:MerR family transcriptional regulator/heat shock protein HspR
MRKKPSSSSAVYDGNEPVYTSGVVCRLLGIPVWVLKQLDRERVVSPSRTKGRSRLYSSRELKKLEKVWYFMSERRVNVHGVKYILEMEVENGKDGRK